MSGAVLLSIDQQLQNIRDLLQDRLGLRGASLAGQLRGGVRLLPRKLRKEALYLAQIEALSRHPKGAVMIDQTRALQAYRACHAYLAKLGARERRLTFWKDQGARIGMIIFLVGALVLGLLIWRGFL